MRKLLLQTLFVALVGCAWVFGSSDYDAPLERFPAHFTYQEHLGGRVHNSLELDRDSPLYKVVFDAIHDNSKGWEKDSNRYPPNYYFVSSTLVVNVVSKKVVIAYLNDRGEEVQISKDIQTTAQIVEEAGKIPRYIETKQAG